MKLSCALVFTLTNLVIATPFSFSVKGSGTSAKVGATTVPFGTFGVVQPVVSKADGYLSTLSKSSSPSFASNSASLSLGAFNYNGAQAGGATSFTNPSQVGGQNILTAPQVNKNYVTGFSDTNTFSTAGGNVLAGSSVNSDTTGSYPPKGSDEFSINVNDASKIKTHRQSITPIKKPDTFFGVNTQASESHETSKPNTENILSSSKIPEQSQNYAGSSAVQHFSSHNTISGAAYLTSNTHSIHPAVEKKPIYDGGFGGPPGVLIPFDKGASVGTIDKHDNAFLSNKHIVQLNVPLKSETQGFYYKPGSIKPSYQNVGFSGTGPRETTHTGALGSPSTGIKPSAQSFDTTNYQSIVSNLSTASYDTPIPTTSNGYLGQYGISSGSLISSTSETNSGDYVSTVQTGAEQPSNKPSESNSDKTSNSKNSTFVERGASFTSSSSTLKENSNGVSSLFDKTKPTNQFASIYQYKPLITGGLWNQSGVVKPSSQSTQNGSIFVSSNKPSTYETIATKPNPEVTNKPPYVSASSSGSVSGVYDSSQTSATSKNPSFEGGYTVSKETQSSFSETSSSAAFVGDNDGSSFNSNLFSSKPQSQFPSIPTVGPSPQQKPSYSNTFGTLTGAVKPTDFSDSGVTNNPPSSSNFGHGASLTPGSYDKPKQTSQFTSTTEYKPIFTSSFGGQTGLLKPTSQPHPTGSSFVSSNTPSAYKPFVTYPSFDTTKPNTEVSSKPSSVSASPSGSVSGVSESSENSSTSKNPSFEGGYTVPTETRKSSSETSSSAAFVSANDGSSFNSNLFSSKPQSQFPSIPTVGPSPQQKPSYSNTFGTLTGAVRPTDFSDSGVTNNPPSSSNFGHGASLAPGSYDKPKQTSQFTSTTEYKPIFTSSFGGQTGLLKPTSQPHPTGSSFVSSNTPSAYKPFVTYPSFDTTKPNTEVSSKPSSVIASASGSVSGVSESSETSSSSKNPSFEGGYTVPTETQTSSSETSSSAAFVSANDGSSLNSIWFSSKPQSQFPNIPTVGPSPQQKPSYSNTFGTLTGAVKPTDFSDSGVTNNPPSSSNFGHGASLAPGSYDKPKQTSQFTSTTQYKPTFTSGFWGQTGLLKPTGQPNPSGSSFVSSNTPSAYKPFVTYPSFDTTKPNTEVSSKPSSVIASTSGSVSGVSESSGTLSTSKDPSFEGGYTVPTETRKSSSETSSSAAFVSANDGSSFNSNLFSSKPQSQFPSIPTVGPSPQQKPSYSNTFGTLTGAVKPTDFSDSGVTNNSPYSSNFGHGASLAPGSYDKPKQTSQFTSTTQYKPIFTSGFGGQTGLFKPTSQPNPTGSSFVSYNTPSAYKPFVTYPSFDTTKPNTEVSSKPSSVIASASGSVSGVSESSETSSSSKNPSFEGGYTVPTETQTSSSETSSSAAFVSANDGSSLNSNLFSSKPQSQFPNIPTVGPSPQQKPSYSNTFGTLTGAVKPTDFSDSGVTNNLPPSSNFGHGASLAPESYDKPKQTSQFTSTTQYKPIFTSSFGVQTGLLKPTSQPNLTSSSFVSSNTISTYKPSVIYSPFDKTKPNTLVSSKTSSVSASASCSVSGASQRSGTLSTSKNPSFEGGYTVPTETPKSSSETSSSAALVSANDESSFNSNLFSSKPQFPNKPIVGPSPQQKPSYLNTFGTLTGVVKPTSFSNSGVTNNPPSSSNFQHGASLVSASYDKPKQTTQFIPTTQFKPIFTSGFGVQTGALKPTNQPNLTGSTFVSSNTPRSFPLNQKESTYIGSFGGASSILKPTSQASFESTGYNSFVKDTFPTAFDTLKPSSSVTSEGQTVTGHTSSTNSDLSHFSSSNGDRQQLSNQSFLAAYQTNVNVASISKPGILTKPVSSISLVGSSDELKNSKETSAGVSSSLGVEEVSGPVSGSINKSNIIGQLSTTNTNQYKPFVVSSRYVPSSYAVSHKPLEKPGYFESSKPNSEITTGLKEVVTAGLYENADSNVNRTNKPSLNIFQTVTAADTDPLTSEYSETSNLGNVAKAKVDSKFSSNSNKVPFTTQTDQSSYKPTFTTGIVPGLSETQNLTAAVIPTIQANFAYPYGTGTVYESTKPSSQQLQGNGVFHSIKPNKEVSVIGSPSSTTHPPYAGGFGGPAGLLKPNDFSAPYHHVNAPSQYSVGHHNPKVSTTHHATNKAVDFNEASYYGGLGGPSGVLKPNENEKHFSSNVQKGELHDSLTANGAHPNYGIAPNASFVKADLEKQNIFGAQATTTTQSSTAATASTGEFINGNLDGHNVQHLGNPLKGDSSNGIEFSKNTNRLTVQIGGLSDFGATTISKGSTGTDLGFSGIGKSFAYGSATASSYGFAAESDYSRS